MGDANKSQQATPSMLDRLNERLKFSWGSKSENTDAAVLDGLSSSREGLAREGQDLDRNKIQAGAADLKPGSRGALSDRISVSSGSPESNSSGARL
jgi:hypothetical protein